MPRLCLPRLAVPALLAALLLAACRHEPAPPSAADPAPPPAATAPALPPPVPPDPQLARRLLDTLQQQRRTQPAAALLDSAYRLAPTQIPALLPQATDATLLAFLQARDFRVRLRGIPNYRLLQLQDLDAATFRLLRRRLLAMPALRDDRDLAPFLHMVGGSLADTAERKQYLESELLVGSADEAGTRLTQVAAYLQQTGGNLTAAVRTLESAVPLASNAALRSFLRQSGWLARPAAAELRLLPGPVRAHLLQRLPALGLPPAQQQALAAQLAAAMQPA